MKKSMLGVIAVLVVALAAGIALAADKTVYVLIDRGIDSSLNEGQVKNRNQIGEAMEEDLMKKLKKAGFNAKLIKDRSEYRGADNAALLSVTITDYNPGNKAARMMVGFGAGATSMKTHYKLTKGDALLYSEDLGVGSGRDWRNVIQKIDEQTVEGVQAKFK